MTEEEKKSLEEEVERTIAEMKHTADDLLKAAAEISDMEIGMKARELADKVGESFERTSAKLNESLQTAADSEQVKKTIEYVRAKTKEIGGYAAEKLSELKKSDKAAKAAEPAGSVVRETALKVGEKINSGIDQLKESESFKRVSEGLDTLRSSDSYRRVADKVTDVAGTVRESVSEFAEKRDLDTKLERAKDVAIELAEKGVSALKRWLKPEVYGRDKEEKK